RRAWLVGMVTIQPIEHDGHIVALVAGGRALLGDQLTGQALALVRAKCLYALEVHAGERAGPYSDQAATRYAAGARAPLPGALAPAPAPLTCGPRRGWQSAPGCGPTPPKRLARWRVQWGRG